MNAVTHVGALALIIGCGCGGTGAASAARPTMEAVPEAATRAALAGPLCHGDRCSCRSEGGAAADGGAGVPEAGLKRFEFEIGPSQFAQWVTVGPHVLYKSPERPTQCFYLDLATGEHDVRLRVGHDGGVQASLHVREFGAAVGSWYKTFEFVCGDGNDCDDDDLAAQKARYQGVVAGKHDPCGSTKVRGLVWDTSTAADGVHPGDLQVDLALQVFAFVPDKASGDPSCGAE